MVKVWFWFLRLEMSHCNSWLWSCSQNRYCRISYTCTHTHTPPLYRSVPLIRPLWKYAPPLFTPKFLHWVVWLVITPPVSIFWNMLTTRAQLCCKCVESSEPPESAGTSYTRVVARWLVATNLQKIPRGQQYCCSWGQLQRSHRECYWPRLALNW